jgi:hypothetical protein
LEVELKQMEKWALLVLSTVLVLVLVPVLASLTNPASVNALSSWLPTHSLQASASKPHFYIQQSTSAFAAAALQWHREVVVPVVVFSRRCWVCLELWEAHQ